MEVLPPRTEYCAQLLVGTENRRPHRWYRMMFLNQVGMGEGRAGLLDTGLNLIPARPTGLGTRACTF
jgi:hypothetical protein